MKTLAIRLLAWLVLSALIAFGAVAFLLALSALPALLLAARVFAPRSRAPAGDAERRVVYEGEFRVLDETPVEHPKNRLRTRA